MNLHFLAPFILFILFSNLCQENIDNQPSLESFNQVFQPERKLVQIKVQEENQIPKLKKIKKASRKLNVKPQVKLFKKIDKIIDEFGLDKELDEKKLGKYFKKLGHNISKQLKERMINKKVMAPYHDSIQEFNRVTQKYNIK